MKDITHEFDQMQAGLSNLSVVLFQYYADLKKAGFNNSQAFELTKEYQRSIWAGARK